MNGFVYGQRPTERLELVEKAEKVLQPPPNVVGVLYNQKTNGGPDKEW